MKNLSIIFFLIWTLVPKTYGQVIDLANAKLQATGVIMSPAKLTGAVAPKKAAIRLVKDTTVKAADEPTFVKLKDAQFHNGTIEVSLLSRLLPDAPPFARGFIGVAFRIKDDNSKFECIYIRPTNGRADDQIRRNHSIQYYSYPDFKFDRLRKEAPEKYESYADMGLNEWIKLKIVVKGDHAQLYLNNNTQPSLIVNDLKHGSDLTGGIGIWVETGTEGFFTDLKITSTE